MPFQKGDPRAKKAQEASVHKKQKIESFLVWLACGGADRMNQIMQGEDDDKFREDFKAMLSYIKPKLIHSENKNTNEYVQKPLTPEEQRARVDRLLDELTEIERRRRTDSKPTESILSGQ